MARRLSQGWGNKKRVALRKGTAATSPVYYLHGDHLGSTSLITDESGGIISQARNLPFGEERWRSGNSLTDFGFTGQRMEAGFGLMDYNARYYSSKLGHFISADTIIPGASNPMAFDRYAYTLNNPLRYTDPSGHGAYCGDDYDPDCLDPYEYNDFKLLEHPEYRRYVASSVRIILHGEPSPAAGIGTVVGDRTVYTHNHWGDHATVPFGEAEDIDVYDSGGNIIGEPGIYLGEHQPSVDFMELTTPNDLNLPNATVASPEVVYSANQDSTVSIVYKDDATSALTVADFQVYGWVEDGQLVVHNNSILNSGDSGGGVYLNGQLIGITIEASNEYAWIQPIPLWLR